MNPSAQFTAVMRAPLVRSIDEQDVTFPLLTASELAGLGEIVRAEWFAKLETNPKWSKLTDIQQFRAYQEISEAIIPTTEVVKRVGTLPGGTWCIEQSLKKGGYDEAQRAAIHEAISPIENKEIAELVSRIRFLPKAKPQPDGGDPVTRPLPVAGEPRQSPAPTGVPSVSSSPDSASTPAA